MNFRYSIFLILFSFTLLQCQSAPTPEDIKKAEEEALNALSYPSMTAEKAQELFESADKVDVLFNDVNVSMSQVTRSDVQGQVTFLAPFRVPKKLDCSESATIIFQAGGDIIGDGRMHLRGDCSYVIFYENNKPSYSATLTEQGIRFYRRILAAGEPSLVQ